MKKVFEKLRLAYGQDREIVCSRDKLEETLGSDPMWLSDLGLEKSDLIRLERLGFALKARYQTTNKKNKATGPHRVRWIIFEDALYKENT